MLRKRELKAVFEFAPDAYYLNDSKGNFIDGNRAAERLLGYRREELIGKNFVRLSLLPKGELTTAAGILARNVLGRPTGPDELTLNRKDGSQVRVEIRTHPIRLQGRSVVLSIARDVTKRKELERQLQESSESFWAIVERNADGILVLDEAEGLVRFANRAAAELLGRSQGELEGSPFEVTKEENGYMPIRTAAGAPGFGETRVTETTWKGKPARLVTIRDVTEGKRAEAALRKTEEQLRHSQKMEAVGRLAGGVAHDFNNLLTAISGYAELGLEGLGSEHPAYGHLVHIASAGERAADLIRHLLAFSRQQTLQPKVLDLNTVVAEFENLIRRTIGEDVELVTSLAPQLGRVKADPGQMEQVLMNLAVNARDAMPSGGRLTIETANAELDDHDAGSYAPVVPGRYVVLCVTDTGRGMDDETQRWIFEPFFTTKKEQGTGLGLSTAYGIVQQSGGYISVSSEPGRGTTFKIYLPRVDQAVETVAPEEASADGARGSETLLVVEDEEIVREFAAEVLSAKGYRILLAQDAEEALQICRGHDGPIHLVVTDVVMPGASGLELVKQVAVERPETKALHISGYTERGFFRKAGFDAPLHFLAKPFTGKALARKVREILDGETS